MAPGKLSALSSKFRSAFRSSRAEDRAQAQEDQDADSESISDSASTIRPGTAASAPLPPLLDEQPEPVTSGAAPLPPAPERPPPPPPKPTPAPVVFSSSGFTINPFTRPIDIYNYHASRCPPSTTPSEAPATDLGRTINFSRPLQLTNIPTTPAPTTIPPPSNPITASFTNPLPPRPLAATLTVVHFNCATTHMTRRKSSNHYAPTLCMTCHKAGEGEMIVCKHCGLRVCRRCAGRLTERNGDLRKMLEEVIMLGEVHVG